MPAIYLDYNATAPMRPEARDALVSVLGQVGNASSVHSFGRAARKNVEMARELVAALVGSRARDVVFTGSGTEANNQLLKAWPERHLFVSAIEHDSVRDVEGHRQSQLPVGPDGQLDVSASVQMVAAHAKPCVVAVMLVNNETGIQQPVAALTQALKNLGRSDIHVHCDAVQAAGKMWIDMVALDVDTMSLSAHKIGGPQGVGAIIHRPGLALPRLLDGGGQERRLRAGTENVAGIVAFGAAADQSMLQLGSMKQLSQWRLEMVQKLQVANGRLVFLSEHPTAQLGTTVNFAVPGVRAETLVMRADLAGVAISAGSACSSGKVNQSPVAVAMGHGPEVAQGSVRLSLGWATTLQDVETATDRLASVVAKFA